MIGWTNKISSVDVADGLSNTFLIGEMHVARKRLGLIPNDGPIYGGSEFYFATRVVGVGAPISHGPLDNSPKRFKFGSWHHGICHFSFADGSVKAIAIDTPEEILDRFGNRSDGAREDI